MMSDLLFVVLLFSITIFLLGYHLVKALGLFHYEDSEKEKIYQDYLEREGDFRVFTTSISILSLLCLLIWYVLNI